MSIATESRKTDLAKPMLQVIDKGGPDKDSPAKLEFSAKQLVLGALFGVIFGFLLQRGGVAKYNVLLGVLLLEDFTVVKVMLTAIVVGTVGIFTMYFMGLVRRTSGTTVSRCLAILSSVWYAASSRNGPTFRVVFVCR